MIAELLGVGEENAIKGAELALQTGLSDRALRSRIARERMRQEICASSNGYFLPKDNAERMAYIKRLDCGAKRRLATGCAVRRSLKEIEGQEVLTEI